MPFSLHLIEIDGKVCAAQLAAENVFEAVVGFELAVDMDFLVGEVGGYEEGVSLDVIPVEVRQE